MTTTERLVLGEIVNNLENSLKTKWTMGDLDDWTDFAKKMQTTIKNSVPIMKQLISEENNPIKE